MGACVCKEAMKSNDIEVDQSGVKPEANYVEEIKPVKETTKISNTESKSNLGVQPHQGVNLSSKRNKR